MEEQTARSDAASEATSQGKGHQRRGKGLHVPTAFTILFIVTVLAAVATFFVPAGQYSKLQYDAAAKRLEITDPHGKTTKVAATQAELKKLGVKIDIDQFTSGSITKPVSIPNTYERLKQNPQGLTDIPSAMVNGTIDGVDVIVFILVLGGLIGVVRSTGAFESGIVALTQRTKGREFVLIFFVALFMIIGGTTIGFEEEAVAFYPILTPVFIAMGYDSIVTVGAIFLASSVGTTFSTINPFSSVIASNAAGIVFTDGLAWRMFGLIVASVCYILYLHRYASRVKEQPESSIAYDDRESFRAQWSLTDGGGDVPEFDVKRKVILVLFVLVFPVMVYGVMALGWWFPQMAAFFLADAIVIMFVAGTGKNKMSEKQLTEAFSNGSSSLVGVSLIIGLARGVNLIMNNGLISDTVLYGASGLVQGMSGPRVHPRHDAHLLCAGLHRPVVLRPGRALHADSGPACGHRRHPALDHRHGIPVWPVRDALPGTHGPRHGDVADARYEVPALAQVRVAGGRVHPRVWRRPARGGHAHVRRLVGGDATRPLEPGASRDGLRPAFCASAPRGACARLPRWRKVSACRGTSHTTTMRASRACPRTTWRDSAARRRSTRRARAARA